MRVIPCFLWLTTWGPGGGLWYPEEYRREKKKPSWVVAGLWPPKQSPPCSQSKSRVSGAVDELVFHTAAIPWTAVLSARMCPVGPETEPPAALAHSGSRLPAVSVYQTPVSRNTQPPPFAIWPRQDTAVSDRSFCICVCVLYLCVCVCMWDLPSIHAEQGLYVWACYEGWRDKQLRPNEL